MNSELFQKQYDFELEQRNSIASATNIPIVAITVVASANCAILVDFQYSQSLICYAFIALAVFVTAFLVYSVFCLFRSFWNYEYYKIPVSSLLKQHYEALRSWHVGNGCSTNDATRNTEADFSDYLNGRLAEASDWNSQNNIVRGNYLHMATFAVATAVVFLLPAGIIYIYTKATQGDKIHVVKLISQPVVSTKEPNMTTNQSSGGNTQPVAAPSSPAPVPNTKPSGPPNTVFRGNTDLPKPNAGNTSKK